MNEDPKKEKRKAAQRLLSAVDKIVKLADEAKRAKADLEAVKPQRRRKDVLRV